MSTTAAVVVNRDGAAHLPTCLQAFRRQTSPLDEIVVVDNASRDGSLEVLERARDRWGGRLRVVRNSANRGFAGGANDGIRATSAPVVVVANFDVRPEPGFLAAAVDALGAHPRCGAVQGRLLRTRPAPSGAP